LIFYSSLTDCAVGVAGCTQLVVGSMLQRQQGIVGARQRMQDLIELALGGCLLAPECAG
jgi:hypothetical protein